MVRVAEESWYLAIVRGISIFVTPIESINMEKLSGES
jgi:hypothetical protein